MLPTLRCCCGVLVVSAYVSLSAACTLMAWRRALTAETFGFFVVSFSCGTGFNFDGPADGTRREGGGGSGFNSRAFIASRGACAPKSGCCTERRVLLVVEVEPDDFPNPDSNTGATDLASSPRFEADAKPSGRRGFLSGRGFLRRTPQVNDMKGKCNIITEPHLWVVCCLLKRHFQIYQMASTAHLYYRECDIVVH